MSACDFAFLPLLDIPFNHLKSDLKMIEAASCGLASLASKVVYGETIQHGVNGELFGSSSEMTACLNAWRTDPQKVASLGQAANQWVRDHRMAAYQVQDRENWYRQLIYDQKELTRQLIERVPQLQEPSIS
jgi:glycosyltransferase involved in cell wall biosynthesis